MTTQCSLNKVKLGLSNMLLYVLHCKTLFEVAKPLIFFCVRLDDQF